MIYAHWDWKQNPRIARNSRMQLDSVMNPHSDEKYFPFCIYMVLKLLLHSLFASNWAVRKVIIISPPRNCFYLFLFCMLDASQCDFFLTLWDAHANFIHEHQHLLQWKSFHCEQSPTISTDASIRITIEIACFSLLHK